MTKELSEEGYLASEVLEILWDFYLLKRPMGESDNAVENMTQLRFKELLIGSLILRLCKLRDDDTRSLSLDQTIKALRKRAASAPPLI